MNGARALPAVSEIATPSTKRMMIRGINQNFFLVFRNAHISLSIDTYRIAISRLS